MIYTGGDLRLAAFHLTDQEQVCWYVAVVGYKPPEELAVMIDGVLSPGEPYDLPSRFRRLLTRRYRASCRDRGVTRAE